MKDLITSISDEQFLELFKNKVEQVKLSEGLSLRDCLECMSILCKDNDTLSVERVKARIVDNESDDFIQELVNIGIGSSKGDVKRLIKNNGLKINYKQPVPLKTSEVNWITNKGLKFVFVNKGGRSGTIDFIFHNEIRIN